MKAIVLGLLVLLSLAAVGGGWYWYEAAAASPIHCRTASVTRGDLRVEISATGTLEPEEVIDVGAQVAGQIQSFGVDPADSSKPVDFGTAVEEGTVLVQIDDSLYAADVDQAKAQLDVARANVQRAEADLGQMRAKLVQTERDWKRDQKLIPSGAVNQVDLDAAQAAYDTAKSTLAVGEATIVQAKQTVLQSESALKRAKRNLAYCTIKSPVKGVIVDRRVNVGQTVVASLNAPSLFLIAKDLKRMEVWASVNEADIGTIHRGQIVRFTVDAFPDEVFRGTVDKIRLNAAMTQNVVTYTVEITTDNSSGKLLPYLTASAQCQGSRHPHAVSGRGGAALSPGGSGGNCRRHLGFPGSLVVAALASRAVPSGDRSIGRGGRGRRGTIRVLPRLEGIAARPDRCAEVRVIAGEHFVAGKGSSRRSSTSRNVPCAPEVRQLGDLHAIDAGGGQNETNFLGGRKVLENLVLCAVGQPSRLIGVAVWIVAADRRAGARYESAVTKGDVCTGSQCAAETGQELR